MTLGAHLRVLAAIGLLALASCGPRGAHGTGTSNGGEETSGIAPLDLGAEVGTTSGCEESTGPPPPPLEECDVAPMREASVEVEGIAPTRSDAAIPCTVEDVTTMPDSVVVLALRCMSPDGGLLSPTIRVTSNDAQPFPLSTDDEVALAFPGGGLFDDVFLTLRRPDGALVLAWIAAGWLPTAAEPSSPSVSFFEPLTFAVDWEGCGYDCDPAQQGCWIDDPCPCTHRLALDVGFDDATRRIVDGTLATLDGGIHVHVVHASSVTARDGGSCGTTDNFPWLRVLVLVRDAE